MRELNEEERRHVAENVERAFARCAEAHGHSNTPEDRARRHEELQEHLPMVLERFCRVFPTLFWRAK